MSSSDKLVFYNSTVCPFAQRAAIALKETEADYEEIAIDLKNKPDWYKDINPELKVPALKAEGSNIAESLVIIEYINDRYPEKDLLPKGALQRAQVRFAIEYFTSKVTSEWFKIIGNHRSDEARDEYQKNINAGLVKFDELLRQQAASGPYFLGEQYSLADVAIAPFYARIRATNQFGWGVSDLEAVKSNSRLAEFLNGITDRPSFKDTYIGDETLTEMMKERFGA